MLNLPFLENFKHTDEINIDFICNWMGNLNQAHAVEYSHAAEFKAKDVQSYTVNGTSYGTYKTAGNLSWFRVFGAGHEVPFYRKSQPSQDQET
jgi:carboxypeptidase D